MIDLEEIKRHRARWTPDDGTSLPTICEHVDALVAEVERLRGERPAVVAWLRQRHNDTMEWDGRVNAVSHTYDHAADCIERGEHRREENE